MVKMVFQEIWVVNKKNLFEKKLLKYFVKIFRVEIIRFGFFKEI